MLPTGNGQPITGVAAITPHLPAIPSFTIDDMAAYVRNHPLPDTLAVGGTSAGSPTILRNTFLASGEASTLLGSLTGRPDGALLGFVELQGSFAFTGAVPAPPIVYPYAFVLFDAQTGNLLMDGGLQRTIPTVIPTPIHSTPTRTATPAAPPQLSVSPPGTTNVSCGSLPLTYPSVTVKNTGGQTLTWHVTATNAHVTVSPSSGSISAGQTQTLSVSQTSGGAGTDLNVTSNGGNATISFVCIVG
jgi:hypothetical protein